MPTNRWSRHVLSLSSVGILGSQGSYGLSMAWNGDRRVDPAGGNWGGWEVTGTGPNNSFRNVGSFEINNGGMFWNYDVEPVAGFTPTPRMSIGTDGVVNANKALRIGSAALPLNRWAQSVIGVGPVGIIGSQGSYGLSLAWNGYRSSADGKWSAIGTGVNNAIRNVGSMERKENGIFFNFDTDPSGEFTPTTRMTIESNGNVGIGISPQSGFKLAVDGKVIAEELQIKLSENWPDYVFEDDYELMPLEELKEHINTEKHLPGIPKANILETDGVAVGEMQRLMMEKIEELTLYVIELKEENQYYEKELMKLKKQIEK